MGRIQSRICDRWMRVKVESRMKGERTIGVKYW